MLRVEVLAFFLKPILPFPTLVQGDKSQGGFIKRALKRFVLMAIWLYGYETMSFKKVFEEIYKANFKTLKVVPLRTLQSKL